MAYKRTLDALTKHINMEAHAKQKILEIREEAKKQQQWFEDQLARRADLAKQSEQILKDQISNMEENHAKEAQLWADKKLQYEARAQGQAAKINTLKLSLDELCAKTNFGTNESEPFCIRTGVGSKNN